MATIKIIVNNAAIANLLTEEGITSSLEEIMQPVEAARLLEKVSARLKAGASSWQEEDALIDEGYKYVAIIGHDRTYQGAANNFKDVVDYVDSRWEIRYW